MEHVCAQNLNNISKKEMNDFFSFQNQARTEWSLHSTALPMQGSPLLLITVAIFGLSKQHSRASLVAQQSRICLQFRRRRFDPWVGKMPWRRKWQTTPVFLPGKFYGQRSLVGYSPWDHESQHSLVTKSTNCILKERRQNCRIQGQEVALFQLSAKGASIC